MVLLGVAMWLGKVPGADAEETPPTPKFSEACRAGWLSFRVVSGRIHLVGTRFGSINSTLAEQGRSERLVIQAKSSGPAVSYEVVHAPQRLLIELSSGNHLLLQWWQPGTPSGPIEYRQGEGLPVTLRIGSGPQARLLEAPSLWHLWILHPAEGRQYLLPLMRIFGTDVELPLFLEELQAELLRADSPKASDQRRWSELVEQLGDDRFARRQAADRELRQAGRLVMTYLEHLDPARLDAEQQYRVQRILRALSESADQDTPASIASWLRGDPAVWLALMERDSASVRQVAQQRLSSLLGTSVAFDPQAAPEIRQQQLEQLRRQLSTR